MTKKIHVILLIISLALLDACSTTSNLAPVVERAGSPRSSASEDPAKERDPALYTVKRGDTLIRIALEYGQNYRDLVAWNSLSNPNDIKVDQVLRVMPPDAGASSSGVQISSVLIAPNEVRPLAPPISKKLAPRVVKRTYSDATPVESPRLELQRPDPAAPAKPPGAAVIVSLPATPVAASLMTGSDDDKLSWIWPSEGKVVATFDEGKNKGIDIAGKAGQQVMAAGSGKVMYAGSGIRGYGNLVIVKHSNSLLSAYAHNRTIIVKEGQSVHKGQMIAEMGDSDADAVKLHFEIRKQGKPVDPSKFLPNRYP